MSSADELPVVGWLLTERALPQDGVVAFESSHSFENDQPVDQLTIEKAAREKISDHVELYRSLVRALKRRQGFGILFLQCTPAKGKEIFSQLRADLPNKQIGQLTLTEPVENLKSLIEAREDLEELNVLFIEGIEHSLSPYIESEIGRNDYYKLEVLPPILDHLNLHRENLRNQFRHLCLVFVTPPFALKYFMYRAVDFFSWHSGIWTFSPPNKELARSVASALNGQYSEYLELSEKEGINRVLALRDLIDSKNQSDEQKSQLLVELAWLLESIQDFESALSCCDESIATQSTNASAYLAKGTILHELGRNEEGISAYDTATSMNPTLHNAHHNKGVLLSRLGRNEEAIAAFDAAIAIDPNDDEDFDNKGVLLSALGRNEEAIAAFDAAIAINPNNYKAHHNKGIELLALGRDEGAISTFNAIIAINPNDHEAHCVQGAVFLRLERYREAIVAYDAALAIKPDLHEALFDKGVALAALDRIEEATAAYDSALIIKPNLHEAFFNKACIYSLSSQLDNAITSLKKALALDGTNKYIEMAKTDSDFDAIRDRPPFQALIAQYEEKQHSEARSL